MEAPEKIILSADRETGELYNDWVIKDLTDNIKIEYVCKDVFIDKVEKYLTEKFIKDVSVLAGGVVSINFDAAINNFVTYLKEEI